MNDVPSVLLLGGTGRTGRQVLKRLLEAGATVRAIVRSAARLPNEVATHRSLEVVEAELTMLSDTEFRRHADGCDAMISCLGHNINLRGIFGPPRDLITRTVGSVVRVARAETRDVPLRVVLLSSVSVHRPLPADSRRGKAERAFLGLLSWLLPPALDNQRAADLLANEVGPTDPHVAWVAVRPDGLIEGEETEFVVSEQLTRSVFRPTTARRSNVARFMTQLVTDEDVWNSWIGGMPVVEDAPVAEHGGRPGS